MFSTTVSLTYYNLRRLARRRWLVAALLILPAVSGTVCSKAGWGSVWLGAVVFAAAAGAAVWLRWRADGSSGLAAAMRCAGAEPRILALSHAAAVLVVIVAQIALTTALLSILP